MTGYVANDLDCNDNPAAGGAAINPYADEICSGGIDEDCDGNTDSEVNKGLDFDGVNDHVIIENPAAFSIPFTVEMWIKPDVNTGGHMINWFNTSYDQSAQMYLFNGGLVTEKQIMVSLRGDC